MRKWIPDQVGNDKETKWIPDQAGNDKETKWIPAFASMTQRFEQLDKLLKKC